MQYQRRKEFAALLTVLSVLGAVFAGIAGNLMFEGITRSFTFITTISAVVAATSALMTIMLSRNLARKREQRSIFLLYAREDLESARMLASELKKHGFNPWLDIDEITPGQVWQKAVFRALEESAVALVLVSEHLMKKGGFVQKELDIALETLQEREKDISPVVPVRLDESPVPERLAHVHWVNLFEENGLERLFAGLNRMMRDTQQAASTNSVSNRR